MAKPKKRFEEISEYHSANSIYQAASAAVEYMIRNSKHFHPEDVERGYGKLGHNLRMKAFRARQEFIKLSDDQVKELGYSDVTVYSDKMLKQISAILLNCYLIQRYLLRFNQTLVTEWAYNDNGDATYVGPASEAEGLSGEVTEEDYK